MVFLNEILNEFSPNIFYGSIKNKEHRNSIIDFIFKTLKLETPKFIEKSEIENYTNVYYPIANLSNLTILEYDNSFGNQLIDLILYKNVKVIFFNTNETHDFHEFKSLNDYLIRRNIPQDRIYLFYNNPKIYEYKKIINSGINVYSPNVIMIEHSNILQRNKVEYSCDKKFLFMCHNKKMHEHRILNLALLHKNKLLDKFDYSCILHYREFFTNSNILNKFSYDEYKESINHVLKISNKKSFFETNVDIDKIDSIEIEIETFKNSYFNLVVETDFEKNLLHPTEKSLKPFYYFQYPIFVAPHGHVKFLKDTYGFDMFDDIIDHSYDLELNPMNRMILIHSEIQKIFKDENFYKNKYKEIKNRLLNNHKLVCDIINSNDDCEYIKNTLYGN